MSNDKENKWLSIYYESSDYTSSAKTAKTSKSHDKNTFVSFDSFGRHTKNSENSYSPEESENPRDLKEAENSVVQEISDETKLEDYFVLFEERAAIMEFEGGLSRTEAEYQAYLAILGDFIMINHPSVKKEFDSLVFPGKEKHQECKE